MSPINPAGSRPAPSLTPADDVANVKKTLLDAVKAMKRRPLPGAPAAYFKYPSWQLSERGGFSQTVFANTGNWLYLRESGMGEDGKPIERWYTLGRNILPSAMTRRLDS